MTHQQTIMRCRPTTGHVLNKVVVQLLVGLLWLSHKESGCPEQEANDGGKIGTCR